MPYPSMTSPPLAASQRAASSGDIGMAPHRENFMDVRSASISSAVRSSRSYMGVTPRKKVHGRRFWEVRTMVVSNLGNSARVAPRRMPARKLAPNPKAWKRGRTQ